MPDSTGSSQPPERPEIVRAQQIAAVRGPKQRAELQALVKSRNEARQPELDRQRRESDKEQAEAFKQIVRSRNAPQPAPPGMKPAPILDKAGEARAMSEARAQVIDRNKAILQAIDRPFNQQIDQRLDVIHGRYDPKSERETKAREFGKTKVEALSFKPPDRDRSR